MGIFSAILLLAFLGFGNTFYVLSLNIIESEEKSIRNDIFTQNYLLAMIYSFRTGLGDFNTDGYDQISANAYIWIAFLLCAIFVQIIMLNLLIAIMSDTYDKVMEISEQSKLKEIACMISEYEFLIDRYKTFKNAKYLIVASVNKSENANYQTWEGKIQNLKNTFQTLLNQTAQNMNKNFENVNSQIKEIKESVKKHEGMENKQEQMEKKQVEIGKKQEEMGKKQEEMGIILQKKLQEQFEILKAIQEKLNN